MTTLLHKPSFGELLDSDYRQHPRYRGCLGHWLVNEGGGTTIHDLVRGRHATLTNADVGTAWTVGERGKVIFLDGTDDHFALNEKIDVSGSFSVAFWLYLIAGTTSWLGNTRWNGSNGWAIRLSDIRARLGDGSGTNIFTAASKPTGQWLHEVFTFDLVSGECLYFRNGSVFETDTTTKTTITSGDHNCVFGKDAAFTVSYLDGAVDDIRVYQRALNEAEARSLYIQPFLEFQSGRRVWAVQLEGLTLTPASASVAMASLNQDPVLGAISLTPISSTVSVGGQAGSSVLGPISLTPTQSPVTLGIEPTTPVQGAVTLSPANSSLLMNGQAPPPLQGSITLTPAQAPLTVSSFSQGVSLGPITLTPSDSAIVWGGVDPTVFASGGFLIAPSAAGFLATTLDPSIMLGGLSVSPSMASNIFSAEPGPIVLGSITLTPSESAYVFGGLNPTINTGEKLATFLTGLVSLRPKLGGTVTTEPKLKGTIETSRA